MANQKFEAVMIHRKIEVGIREKHTVEFLSHLTGAEEIRIDGKTTYKKFSMGGVEKSFEVGGMEKHHVVIKAGFKEQLTFTPVFLVDGVAVPSAKVSTINFLAAIGIAIGTAIGGFIGWHGGLYLTVLIIAGLLLFAVCYVIGKKWRPPSVWAIFSIQLVYAGWMALGALTVKQGEVLVDFALFIFSALWLILRPGLPPLIVIGLINGYGVLLNIVQLPNMKDPQMTSALITHIALRLSIVVGVLAAAKEMFRAKDGGAKHALIPRKTAITSLIMPVVGIVWVFIPIVLAFIFRPQTGQNQIVLSCWGMASIAVCAGVVLAVIGFFQKENNKYLSTLSFFLNITTFIALSVLLSTRV